MLTLKSNDLVLLKISFEIKTLIRISFLSLENVSVSQFESDNLDVI